MEWLAEALEAFRPECQTMQTHPIVILRVCASFLAIPNSKIMFEQLFSICGSTLAVL